MSFRVVCQCGQSLTASDEMAGKQVRCPMCEQKLRLPAVELVNDGPRAPSAMLGLISIGAVGLLVVGVVIGIVISNSGKEPESKPTPVAVIKPKPKPEPPKKPVDTLPPKTETVPPPSHKLPDLKPVSPTPPSTPPKKEVTTPPSTTPPKKVEPTPPVRPASKPNEIPTVLIHRAESFDKGNALRVYLKGRDPDGDGVTFEYRLHRNGDWKDSKDGEIVVPKKIPGGMPTLEARSVDTQGGRSRPLIREWPELIRLQWRRPQSGDTFFQQITVQQQPTFAIQGMNIPSQFRYTILSKFEILKVGQQQDLAVQMKVVGAKLLQADKLSAGMLQAPIRNLPGTTFLIGLNAQRKIITFKGNVAAPRMMNRNFLQGGGFQMASLLDEDGWKEIIQSTFFLPTEPLHLNATWAEKMTHSWGALGMWGGQAMYRAGQEKNNVHPIAYQLQLGYFPPRRGRQAFPLPLLGSKFQIRQATGGILFDVQKGRVTRIEERFHVQGVLSFQLLGQATPVNVDEKQLFLVQIFDKNPE